MADVVTSDPAVDRLLKMARRLEREGKTETATVIYTAASEIARLRQARDPGQFVDFVLRHTFPERARAHGFDTVHSLMVHHPFVQDVLGSGRTIARFDANVLAGPSDTESKDGK